MVFECGVVHINIIVISNCNLRLFLSISFVSTWTIKGVQCSKEVNCISSTNKLPLPTHSFTPGKTGLYFIGDMIIANYSVSAHVTILNFSGTNKWYMHYVPAKFIWISKYKDIHANYIYLCKTFFTVSLHAGTCMYDALTQCGYCFHYLLSLFGYLIFTTRELLALLYANTATHPARLLGSLQKMYGDSYSQLSPATEQPSPLQCLN